MAAFQIGTNVYVGLYNKGRGVVFNIKGEQNTKDIKNFGIFSSGGSAEIDIVFEDGTAFTNTPECIAQGYPKLEQISTQEEIDELVANLHFQTQLRNKKEEEDKIKDIVFSIFFGLCGIGGLIGVYFASKFGKHGFRFK